MSTSPANPTPTDLVAIVELQTEIIDIQNEAIKELYTLLAQHIEVEEIEQLHAMECLHRAPAL